MSLLTSASRQAKRVEQAHFFMPETLSGEQSGAHRLWFVWVSGLFICLLLGASANYAWHFLYNKPVIQRVDVPHPTELPFQFAEQNFDFATEPLPEEVMRDVSVEKNSTEPLDESKGQPVPEATESDMPLPLEKRFMQAVTETSQADVHIAPPRDEATEAMPLAGLPPRISQQVAAMKYGAHVYSSVAENRTININGRDYHEGDEVVKGVILLRIDANSSIFRVGSQSFSLNALTDWPGY